MKNIFVLKYNSLNLGDDIQSIAVMDILDEQNIRYSLVDRDQIGGYYFNPLDENYIIFNGWFTNGYGLDNYFATRDDYKDKIPITWPPTGNFTPIIFSFHISEWGPKENRIVHDCFLDKSLEFYKSAYVNLGCRDNHTFNILNKLGIDNAYVSGCVTLTLNKNKYLKKNINKNKIIFVDIDWQSQAFFREKFNKHFTGEDLEFKSLSHSIPPLQADLLDRFELARRHLTEFCNAKVVVTNRLHVALPCLAFGVPVLFIAGEEEKTNARIIDYMPYLHSIDPNQLSSFDISAIMQPKFNNDTTIYVKNNLLSLLHSIYGNTTSNA